MADFEDSAEQAHFSAFTARVRTGVMPRPKPPADVVFHRWQEILSRFCATALTATLRPCGHRGLQCRRQGTCHPAADVGPNGALRILYWHRRSPPLMLTAACPLQAL